MTEFAYGNTVFCDDIRFEIGGKTSLMGCFGSEMRVFGQVPLMLSSFAAFASVRIPQSIKFEKLTILIIAELAGAPKELAKFEIPFGKQQKDQIEAGQILSADVPFRLAPLLVEGEGFIRCRAYVDDLEVKLGSLRVTVLDVEDLPPEFKAAIPATS